MTGKDAMSLMIEDGLYAGTVAAFISAIPSTAVILATSSSGAEVWHRFKMAAEGVGNVIWPRTVSSNTLIATCVVMHLYLCYSLALLLSYLCLRKKSFRAHLKTCLLIAAVAHLVNLVILPSLLHFPLLDKLLLSTGHYPHMGDHAAFGYAVAYCLASRKRQGCA
jgi:hypothetical protein